MEVYRITSKKWSKSLTASGFPARWNSKGYFVIYTAESRSLACLENLVHRNGLGLDILFETMVIEIPKDISISHLDINSLPKDWDNLDEKAYELCRKFGNQWIREGKFCVLRVPSVIIPNEFNYLINPNHSDFRKIKLIKTEPFLFDKRFGK